jgi:hypothetical protein
VNALPRCLSWRRTDTGGAEHVVFDDRRGLHARGVAVAQDAAPYACHYELTTDDAWNTTRFEATAEGAGWWRSLRMQRGADGWRVTAAEQGTLAGAALAGAEDPDRLYDARDVDLYASPLTNTLPLRRLRRAVGDTFTITAAWVLLPSLAVVASEQTYTVLAPGRVRYRSGTFTADIEVDDQWYVIDYPGLGSR